MIVHVARAAGWSVLCGGALYTFVSTHSWMLVALGAAGAINSGWWAWREFEAVLAKLEADGREVE